MKLLNKLLFFLVIVLFSKHLVANEPLEWAFGHVPPYIYMQDDGQPYGIHAEIVKNILNHAEIDYIPVPVPNLRAKKMVNQGAIPFAMAPLIALDNPDDFYISDIIVVKIDLRAYWVGNQKPITEVSDLNGESVVLITSFDYSGLRDYVENPINKVNVAVEVENHNRALLALSKGRANYMLGYRQPIDLMQLEINIQDLYSYPILQTDIHLFINKSVKNSRQIMDKLELAYSELYIQGTKGSAID